MHTHLFLKCIQLFCSSESHAATRRALCYPFQCSDHVSTTEKRAPALAPYGFCLLIAAADIPSPKAGHFQSLDWVEGWFSSNTRAPLTAALHTCDSVWHGCLGIHLWVVPAASPPCSPPACMPWGGERSGKQRKPWHCNSQNMGELSALLQSEIQNTAQAAKKKTNSIPARLNTMPHVDLNMNHSHNACQRLCLTHNSKATTVQDKHLPSTCSQNCHNRI